MSKYYVSYQQNYSSFKNFAGGDRTISYDNLVKIARDFLIRWEEISPCLGLSQQQEENIRRTYVNYDDQKRAALQAWNYISGEKATYDAFIAAAESIKNMQLADGVRKLLPG